MKFNSLNPVISRSQKDRDSNIELLRIVCVLSVITLHFCNATPDAFSIVADKFKTEYFILRLLYSFSIVAVDTFLVISGYFMIERNSVKIGKAINLLMLTSAYAIAWYLIRVIFGNGTWEWKAFVWTCIPRSYFVYMYISVYLLSPFINRSVKGLSQKQYLTFIVICTLLFGLWNSFINLLSGITGRELTSMFTVAQMTTDRGFTIVTFILMYLWGVYKEAWSVRREKDDVYHHSSYMYISYSNRTILLSSTESTALL